MTLSQILTSHVQKAVQQLFDVSVDKIELQATRREFEGDITMVIFPLLKLVKSNPVELGNKIGQYLVDNSDIVNRFNVVSGFLNIVISDAYYINFFNDIKANEAYGTVAPTEGGKAVMVEFASPNTNKPLHLGHVRNVLLGYSVSNIIQAAGSKVYKTQVVNDRGIHICKSMLAWQRFAPLGNDGEKETPYTTNDVSLLKGDKFVGKYYVEFDKAYKKELKQVATNELKKHIDISFETGIVHSVDVKEDTQLISKIKNSYQNILREYILLTLDVTKEEVENSVFWEINLSFKSSELTELAQNLKDQMHKLVSDLPFLDTDSELDPNANEEIQHLHKNIKEANKKLLSELESEKYIVQKVTILNDAQEMLRDWEAGKPDIIELWATMNGWVYKGFEETYANIGVDFDSYYYESNTYLLGKDVVADGLAKGVFEKDPDGSVWIDLTADGLDRKIVLRSDGTSVYMTQDIGTAIQRVKDFPDVGGMVYTVGNEQDYHFKVLFLILKKLGFDWAANLYHLSYGMVDLPSGKMKSREGTVVDADDLMAEMTSTAQSIAEELGKLEGYSDDEKARLYNIIGLGALKYYILKVDPKKRILFDPKESVDFAGNTGPFIQYTYARIQSLLRRADFDVSVMLAIDEVNLHEKEKELIKAVSQYPDVIQAAADGHSPALIANYTYDLVREYNSFYQSVPVLGTEVQNEKVFRIQLSKKVGETIKSAFGLLGIGVPERM